MKDKIDYLIVCVVVLIFVVLGGVGILVTEKSAPSKRSPISNHSTYAQVKAHFDGKPAGSGPYLAGFKTCSAWSNGRKGSHGHQSHGWILIGCSK